jgi:hypothetical protein
MVTSMARHKWDPICDPPRGLVRPVRIGDPDGPTRAQAQGPRWRAVGLGWYVRTEGVPEWPEQRVLEASVLLPPDGAVTGWGSARLSGATFLDGLEPDLLTRMPVPLAVPPGRHPRDRNGVRFLRSPLDEHEIYIRQTVRCVKPERAAFDAMRSARDEREATVALDMMAAAELTSVGRARVYTAARAGWKGVELVRAGLALADEDSRSPNETRMRLIWLLDAKLPRPRVNKHIWDLSGRLLGIADLLDEEAGLVGEFDGADHRGARRQSKDEDRAGRFRDHGLEIFRVTGPDLGTPTKVVVRMLAARRRAKFLPPEQRTWTTTPPRGWEPTQTLDELLDEREAVRAENERWEAEREAREAELRAELGRLS